MKKRTLIVNQKRFAIFIILTALFLFSIFFMAFSWMSKEMAYGMADGALVEAQVNYQKVVVKEGDTVWAIAEKLAQGKKKDVRDIVREIYRLNNLGKSTLHPGQPLLIPNI